MRFLLILLNFIWIGFLTIGGGLVSVSLIDQFLVQPGWITRQVFEAMISIAEATPGPIAINIATYVGFKELGVVGAFSVTLAYVLPSVVAVWTLSLWLIQHQHLEWIKTVMSFLKLTVSALIFYAVYRLMMGTFLIEGMSVQTIAIQVGFIAVMLGLSFAWPKNPYLLLVAGALFGFFFL